MRSQADVTWKESTPSSGTGDTTERLTELDRTSITCFADVEAASRSIVPLDLWSLAGLSAPHRDRQPGPGARATAGNQCAPTLTSAFVAENECALEPFWSWLTPTGLRRLCQKVYAVMDSETYHGSDNPRSLYGARRSGVCVWLTGLSGAGKSTTALALYNRLTAAGYVATLVDGDSLRETSPRPLGFSRADRDANVLHAAAIAKRIVDSGAVAVCALISPYRAARTAARQVVGLDRFVEVFVDTPLHVCQARDPKGLYCRYRCGEVRHLTGVDDPYEAPLTPDLRLLTEERTALQNADCVFHFLINVQLLPARVSQTGD